LKLKTLHTQKTLQDWLQQGEIVLKDFLKKHKQGAIHTGLTQEAFLKELHNCNCFLKDIALGLIALKQMLNSGNLGGKGENQGQKVEDSQ
jgi:hypothetical protein